MEPARFGRNVQALNQESYPVGRFALTFHHQRIGTFIGNYGDPVRAFRILADLIRGQLLQQDDHVCNPGFLQVDNFNGLVIGHINALDDPGQARNVGGMVTDDQRVGRLDSGHMANTGESGVSVS